MGTEAFGQDVAQGLRLRHDHGCQYMSHVFQEELAFVGIASSPALVREPEGNGCAEHFIWTLKEHLLWLQTFNTVEELRVALHDEEARAHLGMETQRQWHDRAIARCTPALLSLYSIITLTTHLLIEKGASRVRRTAWYAKTHPTFSDAMALARRHVWDHLHFSTPFDVAVKAMPLTVVVSAVVVAPD